MILLNCHIENFGTLKDASFDFTENYNLFEKDNGWGKSTLAAFIKVMFYGFDGERQRRPAENERRKYQPWQGGPYGGSITFRLNNGKCYEATRIFSDKPKEDVFSLRDAKTNAPSSAFSENLGEEVFHVDKEAFKRSFYISQGDRFTRATDGINAKIGGLFQQSDDIGNYEEVEKRLSDILNKNSPTRKTGSLYKLSEAIAHKKENIRVLTGEVTSIPELEIRTGEIKARIDEIINERENVRQKQNDYFRMKEFETIRARYEDASEYYNKCLGAFEQAEEDLEGADTTQEEVSEYMESAGNLASVSGRIEAEALTEEQTGLLESYEEKKLSPLPVVLGVIGALGVALAVVFIFLSLLPLSAEVIICCLGLALIAVAIILYSKASSKLNSNRQLYELYSLQKKRLDDDLSEFDALRDHISSYLNLQNISLEDEPADIDKIPSYLRAQLEGLDRKLILLSQTSVELDAAKGAREKFETDEYFSKYLNFEMPEDAGSPDSFDAKLFVLQQEETELRHKLQDLESRLDNKRIKADELEEKQEEFALLTEEYASGTKKYDLVSAAYDYLSKAKEMFTAKYSTPVMKAFAEYCQAISGEDASIFHVDANSNITMNVSGMQRSSDFLSAGYRDLVGIALRMAFVDAMFTEEKPFIVMDDPLVNLDSFKSEAAASFIRKISENHQIIYFTCHSSRSI